MSKSLTLLVIQYRLEWYYYSTIHTTNLNVYKSTTNSNPYKSVLSALSLFIVTLYIVAIIPFSVHYIVNVPSYIGRH